MRSFLFAVCWFVLTACSQPKVRRYELLLDPLLGKAKKTEINSRLGDPQTCGQKGVYKLCEYRTASERNLPVPAVMVKRPGHGPDLSPYEYFDVLHLYYDDFWILREWEPVVVHDPSK